MIVSKRACYLVLTAGFLAGIFLCAVTSAQAQQNSGSAPIYVDKNKTHKSSRGQGQVYSLSRAKNTEYPTWEEMKAQKSQQLGAIMKQAYAQEVASENYAFQAQIQAMTYGQNGSAAAQTTPAKAPPKMVYQPGNTRKNTQNGEEDSGGNRLWNKFWR